jgi:GNAT superfamily N-acetyltransferase
MTSVITHQDPVSGVDSGARGLRVTTASPDDDAAVTAMVERCSQRTLSRRFHGSTDGIAYTRAQLRTRTDIVRVAWWDGSCVALGVLAAGGEGPWELGVLVEDAWQRQGVGRLLVASLVSEARLRNVSSLVATVLGDDAAILRPLRRLGSSSSHIECGTVALAVRLDEPAPTSRRLGSR